MPICRVREADIYCESHGRGEPLLMIMGLGASALEWEPALIEELARSFRVIIYDNRGTGRSDKRDEECSIEGFADDADALLGVLGADRTHVFGISMGGMIAQELALRHPARVHTLVLGGTTAGGRHAVAPPPESMKLLMAPRGGLSDDEIIRRSWPLMYTPAYLRDHNAELEAAIARVLRHPTPPFAIKRHLDATFRFKTWDRLPGISAPTLVMSGAEDVLMPARNSEIIAGRIPGARLCLIPGAGHMFFHEKRADFIAALVPFLKAHPMSPAA